MSSIRIVSIDVIEFILRKLMHGLILRQLSQTAIKISAIRIYCFFSVTFEPVLLKDKVQSTMVIRHISVVITKIIGLIKKRTEYQKRESEAQAACKNYRKYHHMSALPFLYKIEYIGRLSTFDIPGYLNDLLDAEYHHRYRTCYDNTYELSITVTAAF